MVWKLGAIKGSSGDAKRYCFVAPGAYKIGRKDCAVSIATDKTVSRIHAEIVVLPPPPSPAGSKSRAVLKDLSKFGTFVNKKGGSGPVSELPGKESSIADGDEITFGTGSSTFRVSYEHFFFCVSATQARSVISKANAVLGAQCLEQWNDDCTHLLVEDGSAVTAMVLAAIGQQKPVVSLKWLETVAGSGDVVEDIPKCSSFVPSLKLEMDNSCDVTIAQPDARLSTYEGIIFLATSPDKYFSKGNLKSIVSAAGGSVQIISKKSTQDSNRQQIIIVPHLSESESDFTGFQNLQRIREKDLVLGILSGIKDISAFFVQQPQRVTESQSTDATVDLQESEDDADSIVETPLKKIEERKLEPSPPISHRSAKAQDAEPLGLLDFQDALLAPAKTSTKQSIKRNVSDSFEKAPPSRKPSSTYKTTKKEDKDNEIETEGKEYGEVRYVVGLVVEHPEEEEKPDQISAIDFKNFRRVGAVSGNSFHALVPFDTEGYRETSYFDDIEEAMKQEQKKAREEAMADDFFELDDVPRKKRASSKATTTANKRQRK